MNRFDRIVAILIKLQTRRVITAADLAESFGVSQRTIYRDIRSLENAGVPVGGEAGVGYYLSPGYHLPPVAFTADEAAALLVGDRFVRTHAPGATSQAYEGALAKVRAVLETRDKDAVANLDGSVAVYPNGPHRHPPTPDPWLEECQRALARACVAEVTYQRRDGAETRRRQLEPVGLYHARSNWHLVAWCRLRRDYRDFRLDRMASLTMLDETYHRGRHPSLADYMTARDDADDLITVDVGFPEEVAGWVGEARYGWGFAAERREGREVRMQFLVPALEPLAQWLLTFAGRVTVHEPAALRRLLAVHAAAILGAYGAVAPEDAPPPIELIVRIDGRLLATHCQQAGGTGRTVAICRRLGNPSAKRHGNSGGEDMAEAAELTDFRMETRAWLEENCPPGARGEGQVPTGSSKIPITDPDVKLWLDRMAEKGWTVPTWPKAYGGADLSTEEYVILVEEMRRINARAPLMGMGTGLIGPTLLEYGTEDQKQRHLPPIARGEVAWCQGYSEPSAGSDLASLRTRAEDKGDHFLINGQKIWTSGAHFADWMFALVRTDPDAPKHDGISFVLLTMDQPGVTVKPIRLISGNSPFCETFFENAIARKEDLVGELNKGWTVGKRLLQHERSGMSSLVGGRSRDVGPALDAVAREYVGTDDQGRIADPALRRKVVVHNMNSHAFRLTQRKTVEESQDGQTPGPATSIFKMYGTELQQNKSDLVCQLRGFKGYGWEGDAFSEEELEWTRNFLANRAASIYSGSNEIQRNIIAKRVLGLPD